jgi:hypothetical protein
MAGFLAQALSVLLRGNEQVVMHAKVIAGIAACRQVRIERVEECVPNEAAKNPPVVRWSIDFESVEDALAFEKAVGGIISAVHEEDE